jgi:hypothetical protein
MEMEQPRIEGESAEALTERAVGLSLEDQRELVLRLAPRVLARLPEEQQQAFLQELEENLTLARVNTPHPVPGDSNPGVWEMPDGH